MAPPAEMRSSVTYEPGARGPAPAYGDLAPPKLPALASNGRAASLC